MVRRKRYVPAKALAVVCLTPLSMAVMADDVGFGVGLSYVFGEGPAVGVKAFSSDRRERGALALGLDYVFENSSFRPNVGVAYLGRDYFLDANVGYTLKTESFNIAAGAGWADTKDHHHHSNYEQSSSGATGGGASGGASGGGGGGGG